MKGRGKDTALGPELFTNLKSGIVMDDAHVMCIATPPQVRPDVFDIAYSKAEYNINTLARVLGIIKNLDRIALKDNKSAILLPKYVRMPMIIHSAQTGAEKFYFIAPMMENAVEPPG